MVDRSRRSRRESRADGLRAPTEMSASIEGAFASPMSVENEAPMSVGTLTRATRRNNRARRLTGRGARRTLLSLSALAVLAGATAGCSLSFPIASLKPDGTPTGTIDRSSAFLSPALDGEDLRRAKAALSIALDPQGNGARVSWQNPQSGARGAFTASDPPFTEHDRVCRAFAAEVVPGAGAERRLSGSACRESDGSWELRGAEDRKA